MARNKLKKHFITTWSSCLIVLKWLTMVSTPLLFAISKTFSTALPSFCKHTNSNAIYILYYDAHRNTDDVTIIW